MIQAKRLGLHTLLVSSVDASVAFYVEHLGMSVDVRSTAGEQQVQLSFVTGGNAGDAATRLHLVQTRDATGPEPKPDLTDGYWKIAVTLADVDSAVAHLRSSGVEVSDPAQFRDIGYLCHFDDPDGHTIELLQHTFGPRGGDKLDPPADEDPPLGGPGHFGLITLRVVDIEASLRFYRDTLGMRLLSRQAVEPHGFTLYFLACADETPPRDDIDAVENREWLWQRSYTMLELQHRWGDEFADTRYRVGDETGFRSLTIEAESTDGMGAYLADFPVVSRADGYTVTDPDGYTIHIVDSIPEPH